MDAFVRRLIERLHDPSQPLSRNRHFHTFASPEGRRALATSRRLKSLQRDILACARQGQPATVEHRLDAAGEVEIQLQFAAILGKRSSRLRGAEFELLRALPGVVEALGIDP
jgi:hypothetical protein